MNKRLFDKAPQAYFLFFALAAPTLVVMPRGAQAEIVSGPLPEPSYSGTFQVGASGYICSGGCVSQDSSTNQSIVGPGSLSYSGSAPLISDGENSIPPSNYTTAATASGSFSFSQNPSPSLKMYGSASSVPVNGAGAYANIGNATLLYSMEITGPTPSVSVKVDAHGGVTVSSIAAGSFGNTFAEVYFGINGQFSDSATVYSYDGLTTRSFNDTGIYTLQTNYVYTLELYANLDNEVSGNLGGGTSILSGYIDPTFAIVGDNASAYTLSFSPNVGNSVGAVPEPSSWAMMVLGFIGLSYLARRKQTGGAARRSVDLPQHIREKAAPSGRLFLWSVRRAHPHTGTLLNWVCHSRLTSLCISGTNGVLLRTSEFEFRSWNV